MRTERFDFPNAKGEKLAALLDLPLGKPTAYALFAHCFTCGKDNLAAKRIAERLTEVRYRRDALRFHRLGHAAKANSPTRIFPPMSRT